MSRPSSPNASKYFVLVLAAAWCLANIAGAAVLPAEKLAPDDTLVLVTVPNFAKAQEILKHSARGQLWMDPSLRAFRDKFVNRVTEDYVTPLERDLGVHLSDYASLPQGQLTFVMTQNGWTGGDTGGHPGLLLLVDTKDKSSQLRTNLADLKKKWLEAGKKVRSEKIRDVDFSVITISTNELPKSLKKEPQPTAPNLPEPLENPDARKNADKNEAYVGQTESLLVVGNSGKLIEKVLARMAGGEVKTVGDLPEFESCSPVFRDAAAFGWVNAKALVNLLLQPDPGAADGEPNMLGFQTDKLVSALGLKGLRQAAFSYRDSEEGAQGTLFLGVPESSRAGVFQILAGEGKDCSPPPFVPADTLKFQRVRIDGQKAWATVKKMVNDVDPQYLNQLNLMLSTAEAMAKQKNPDFDINKNIFGNLGDDFITYSKAPKAGGGAGLDAGPSLFLLGSPNPEQLVDGLKSTLGMFSQGGGPAVREFLGRKIYSLPLPAMPSADGADGTNAAPRSLSYACSGGYLAVTTDAGMLEEYLRSSQDEGKPLRDVPGLRDAIQKVSGSGTSILGYSNDTEVMRAMMALLKKDISSALSGNPLAPLAAAMGVGGDTKLKQWFDGSLLPGFDEISKYFSFSVYSETATADGLVFKSLSPAPPQLKK